MENNDMVPNLRDQFAMAALTGIMANTEAVQSQGGNSKGLAQGAYNLADAMLAAREVK